MKQALLVLLVFAFCTTGVLAESGTPKKQLDVSLKEEGIASYKRALRFARKGNRERANHWFRSATFLAHGMKRTQVPNAVGRQMYRLAQFFWKATLFQQADYWFQESAVQTYAGLLPRWRRPRPIPPAPLTPQTRPYYAGQRVVLPLTDTLSLKNDIGSIRLNNIHVITQDDKAIIGMITNQGPLPIPSLRLKAYLYDGQGRVLKITPTDGYVVTVLTDLAQGDPHIFHLPFVLHETPDPPWMVSFSIDAVHHDARLYLTEGHAARHPIMIYSLSATPPDALESVSVKAHWVNTGKRAILAISFQVTPYAAMGLKRTSGKIRRHSTVWLKQSGRFAFGHHTDGYRWENVWYNNAIACVKLTAIRVEFENGRRLMIHHKKSPKLRPAHYFYKNTPPPCPADPE